MEKIKPSACFSRISCGQKFISKIFSKAQSNSSTFNKSSQIYVDYFPQIKRERNFISTKFHKPLLNSEKQVQQESLLWEILYITKLFTCRQNLSELSNNYFKGLNQNLCSNLRNLASPGLPRKLEKAFEKARISKGQLILSCETIFSQINWKHFPKENFYRGNFKLMNQLLSPFSTQ